MATIKITLDTRRRHSDGTYPLRIAVSHKGNTAYITLPVSVDTSQWDNKRLRVVNHERKQLLNKMLADTLADYQRTLYEFTVHNDGSRYTAIKLRDALVSMMRPTEDDTKMEFGAFFRRFGSLHQAQRTRDIYKATWTMLQRYTDGNAESIRFADITREWLDRFFLWMAATSPSVNARNIHLRNIRAAFNAAIDEGLTDLYPFRRYRIKPVETPKRSLTPQQLRYIFTAQVEPWQQKYVDIFRLSFLLIGINPADLLTLPADCIRNGRLEYNRHKTHRLYSVKLLPEALDIINRYKGERLLLNVAEGRVSYRPFADKMNRTLQTIIPGVTCYYARHSWATIAASLDIPKETIAQALGHGSNTVTDIYIRFDRCKVDEANKLVADAVMDTKNPGDDSPG